MLLAHPAFHSVTFHRYESMAGMRIRVWNGAAEAATASVENTAAKCILAVWCGFVFLLTLSWARGAERSVTNGRLSMRN